MGLGLEGVVLLLLVMRPWMKMRWSVSMQGKEKREWRWRWRREIGNDACESMRKFECEYNLSLVWTHVCAPCFCIIYVTEYQVLMSFSFIFPISYCLFMLHGWPHYGHLRFLFEETPAIYFSFTLVFLIK